MRVRDEFVATSDEVGVGPWFRVDTSTGECEWLPECCADIEEYLETAAENMRKARRKSAKLNFAGVTDDFKGAFFVLDVKTGEKYVNVSNVSWECFHARLVEGQTGQLEEPSLGDLLSRVVGEENSA